MTRAVAPLCLLLIPTVALAASRTFTDHEGNTLKAEFSGVKDGEVLLREKGTRKSFPLTEFSLDDRDFIIGQLKDKKNHGAIRELMDRAIQDGNRSAATANAFGKSDAGTPQNGRTRPMVLGQPTPPQSSPGGAGEVTGIVKERTMYGISLPSDELLEAPESRSWSDLLEQSQSGTFERVIEPGVVVLKVLRANRTLKLPLAILSREDVQYVQELLKTDQERPVFPADSTETLTSELESQGYRKWTDRRGETLTARFVRREESQVVFQVGEIERSFPYAGLSAEDRTRVDGLAGARTSNGGPQVLGAVGPSPPAPPQKKTTTATESEENTEEPRKLGVPTKPRFNAAPNLTAQPGNPAANGGPPAATVTPAPGGRSQIETFVGYGLIALVVVFVLKKALG